MARVGCVHERSALSRFTYFHSPVQGQPSGAIYSREKEKTPRGGPTPPPSRAQPLLLLSRSNPPTEGGVQKKKKRKRENPAHRMSRGPKRPVSPCGEGGAAAPGRHLYTILRCPEVC